MLTKCKKNTNGINYVKLIQEYPEIWEDRWRLITLYYIYNGESAFYGIVWSNERFNTKDDTEFDLIIDSLRFIK